jgi:exodeoxyribonuclease VII large subunit
MNERSSGLPWSGQGTFLFSKERAAADASDGPAGRRQTWAVGELVRVVRQHIERDYADVWVEGEVSNLRSAPSGHKYFTLKDGEAQLPVVMFKRQAQLLRSQPRDGLHVRVRGKVTVYEQRGQMQLVAETLEELGTGSLQEAFEKLKLKLGAEGLFAAERKKPLPAFPRCVGIVTSPSGAVIRDFLNVTARRHAALDVVLYPAVVQGDVAAAEIAAGITHFNRANNVDVIVIARGGGSLEDLAPFNSETLARVIASSLLPVVSAVGHETEERVEELQQRLLRACRYQLMMASERFSRVSIAAASARVRDGLGRRQQRLDELQFRLEAAVRRRERGAMVAVQELSARLMRHEPSQRLRAVRANLNSLEQRLFRCTATALEGRHSRLKSVDAQLISLSPLSVLGRGYAVIFDESGGLVRDAAPLRRGETLTSRVAKGHVTSIVTDTQL